MQNLKQRHLISIARLNKVFISIFEPGSIDTDDAFLASHSCAPDYIIIFFQLNCLIFHGQSEEEAGSAGEQPASNKIDAYTEKGVEHFDVQPLLFSVSSYG